MREEIKLKLLLNIIEEITRKYEELLKVYEELNKELEYKASHDPLTGLYNRISLSAFFKREAGKTDIYNNSNLALIFIDIDNFKSVNDTYGHEVGDKILREVAKIISESLRRTDLPFRFGGDEFLILASVKNSNEAVKIAERIRKKIEDRFKDYGLSASFGIAVYKEDGKDLDTLIDIADKRMYEMKAKKKAKAV